MSIGSTLKSWSRGVRLYIAIGIVLFTLEGWWWASVSYSGSFLFATRLEELYAWTALALLSISISIGPICSTWRGIPGKRILFDARRLLGIGAAWFAALHISIAYDSLFKFANPLTLPRTYQQAFAAGIIALLVLLAMAFTSFDKAFNKMGVWWFRLHRFVYLAVILVLFHALLIGTHTIHWPELIILTVAVLFILGLHIYLAFFRKKPATKWQKATIPVIGLLLVATLFFGYSQRLDYHPFKAKPKTSPSQMQDMPGMQGMQGMEGMHSQ